MTTPSVVSDTKAASTDSAAVDETTLERVRRRLVALDAPVGLTSGSTAVESCAPSPLPRRR